MYRWLVTTIGDVCSEKDASLINPSGLIANTNSIWVASTGGSGVIKYNRKGCNREVIAVPSPTSICWGKCGTIYVGTSTGSIYTISKGESTATFVTTISGATRITGLAYYKDRLYVAVPSLWYVQVWDTTATPLKEVDALVDESISPFGYKPLGVSLVCGKIYVTYTNDTTQQGFGYVNKYDIKCPSMERFASRGYLTSPNSVAEIDGVVYVANNNGYILTYTDQGEYLGKLRNDTGAFFSDGLRGIVAQGGKLYYVAATNGGSMGTLGVIEM